MPISLEEKLGGDTAALLIAIGEAARDFGVPSFLVGGAVRDALLGLRAVDIDIMLEGDAGEFAAFLKKEWLSYIPGAAPPEKLVIYSRYRTAKLPLVRSPIPGLDCLDFSSARSEEYPAPAQAPIVKPGDLYTDLERRDFTINALAVDLTPLSFGVMRDFFSGEEHLKAGVLHIIHGASFEDDPARMLRGLRFVARFGFRFSDETSLAFKAALNAGNLQLLPPPRLFDEIRKALCEDAVLRVAEVFADAGVLEQSGGLALTARTRQILEELSGRQAGDFEAQRWQLAFCALTSHLTEAEFGALLKHYGLHKRAVLDLEAVRKRLFSDRRQENKELRRAD